MLDKYWDGLLWHIFSPEVCEHHSREKPVQVNQLWSKTHLSSFLCQHKLYLLNPKEDHVDSIVTYAVFTVAKWHKEYGLELRAGALLDKMVAVIKAWTRAHLICYFLFFSSSNISFLICSRKLYLEEKESNCFITIKWYHSFSLDMAGEHDDDGVFAKRHSQKLNRITSAVLKQWKS